MAVTLSTYPSRLKLVRETGMTDEGKPIYKSRTYTNIKAEVSNEALYEVADALKPLFEHPIVQIERHDSGHLVNI